MISGPGNAEVSEPLVDAEHNDVLRPGATVGGYVVDRLLGAGGCATVYAVTEIAHGRRAALKVLHRWLATSPKLLERFTREIEVIKLLAHAAIVEIYDHGTLAAPGSDAQPYYVMELLDGTDLESMVRAGARFSPAEALELLTPVCAALDLAHRAGVIHRDLKASNVIVSGTGDARRVKIVDFGVAKMPSPLGRGFSLTTIGRQVGTPFSMAPEQIRADGVDARTDVYALGVLLFFLLTRHHPFEFEDPLDIELAHLEAPAPRPSKLAAVGRAVDAVVLHCLEKRPEARPASALAFLEELRFAVPGSEPARAKSESVPSLGVYVEARDEGPGDGDDDDALFERAAVIDAAEATLRAAGYSLPLHTTSAVLGVKPLAAVTDPHRALGDALALYGELSRQLAAEQNDRIRVVICVHEGAELLQLSSWLPTRAAPAGAWATSAAMKMAGLHNLSTSGAHGLHALEIAQALPDSADRRRRGET